MRFFTRSLVERVQNEESGGPADTEWDRQVARMDAHYRRLRPSLPIGLSELSKVSLHDGVILSAEWDGDDFVLEIDGTFCPWCEPGRYRLSFVGANLLESTSAFVNREWLYEEIHQGDDGRFVIEVLFDVGELRVEIRDVILSLVAS